MRKYFIYPIIAIFAISCGQNLSRKAEELAKTEILPTLYHPESYEPIQTIVDTAFVTIYTDFEILQMVDDYDKYISEKEDTQRELEWARIEYNTTKSSINSAKSSVAMWSRPYDAWSREQLRQAQEELQEVQLSLTTVQQKIDDISQQLSNIEDKIQVKKAAIKQRASEIDNNEVLGWAIVHRFSCANGLGTKKFYNILIIADIDMEYAIYHFSLDEDEKYSLKSIKDKIDGILDE